MQMEDFSGAWMKVTLDSNLQQTIVLDNRDSAAWNATREICQTYSVPYYKPLPAPGSAAAAEGAQQEVPPWLRTRGGAMEAAVGLADRVWRRLTMGGLRGA